MEDNRSLFDSFSLYVSTVNLAHFVGWNELLAAVRALHPSNNIAFLPQVSGVSA